MDYNLPGSSVHGIFQARIPKRVAISTPGDLCDAGIQLESLASPALQADSLPWHHQIFKKESRSTMTDDIWDTFKIISYIHHLVIF